MKINEAMLEATASCVDKRRKLPTATECEQLENILHSAQQEGRLSERQVKDIMVKTVEFFYGGCTRKYNTGNYVLAYNPSCGLHTLVPI